MPEKADISRTLLLPFMSIILLVAVYMTANVLAIKGQWQRQQRK